MTFASWHFYTLEGKKDLKCYLLMLLLFVCCCLSAPDGSALLQNKGSGLLSSRADENSLLFCLILFWKENEGKHFNIIPQPRVFHLGEKKLSWYNLFSVVHERVKIKLLVEYKEIKSLHCDQNERFEPFLFVSFLLLHI